MLKLKTLGGLGLLTDGVAPAATQRQRLALLALLAAAGEEGLSRERIIAFLWPESSEESARHSLGQLLYALRRDVGSSEAVLGTTSLSLNRDVISSDLWEFEEAVEAGEFERAAALYAGPFLEGAHLAGSAELEQWVDRERHRLADLNRRALESAARAVATRGDALGAVQWWRRLAAADPLSSRVALGLMRALAATGDSAAALQAARVHETLVRSELETEPDPAVAAYCEELRIGKVPPRVAAQTLTRVAERAEPPTAAGPSVGHPAKPGLARWMTFAAAGVAAVVIMAVAIASRGASNEGTPQLDPKRVYVAPFENRTGDASLAAIGSMAADWVTHGLDQSGLIQIASAARAEEAAAPESATSTSGIPSEQAARRAARLGSGTVVSGAYYRQGDSLVFQVRVTNVARGEVLATIDPVSGPVRDPLQPIEQLRQRTVGVLASLFDPRLATWVRVATKPPTYEAYREFVTGQSIWAADYPRALTHFERAVSLDSTFYLARVEIAILYRVMGRCDRTDSAAQALSAVRSRLAPYELHILDAQVANCYGDWQRAYEQQLAITTLRPGSALLDYGVALSLETLGRFKEAAEALGHHDFESAAAQVGPNYFVNYAHALLILGEPVRALDAARRVRRRFPDRANAWGIEGAILANTGRVTESMQVIDSLGALSLIPVAQVPGSFQLVAVALEASGHPAESRQTLAHALAWLESRPVVERAAAWHRLETARTLYMLGRWADARPILEQLAAADTTTIDAIEYRGLLGLIAAHLGEQRAAQDADAWLRAARVPYALNQTYFRAQIAAVLGQRDEALTLLRTALAQRGYFSLFRVRGAADLASLRGDPRFEDITRPR